MIDNEVKVETVTTAVVNEVCRGIDQVVDSLMTFQSRRRLALIRKRRQNSLIGR